MNINLQQDSNNLKESQRIANIYQKIAKNYDFLGEYLLGMIFSSFGYGHFRQKRSRRDLLRSALLSIYNLEIRF